ncbi:VOC family protein [Stackebrandtia nassauensis]|uniref:Glyoxalase/bleomycin resistance protein/dioxygenase n=1 Tax=Stackebrandtia nassauensis (strain DSM 44728 / CIP 108903 / NRRL B-16338 / NBRC 102104 / LLR-40K-21) TaxID=446470 RepID=D3PY78_STANL|nr:VOC family protein [Stackebrandtia nassauensis]ADD41445.1 Glyoxalase/bleomycin resistance protein/dioxygenase [Stackebrandtia nassauensis DSM 44728]
MSLKVINVTINTTNPAELAQWWVTALDGKVTADFGDFIFTQAGDIGLGFQKAEPNHPNRVHMDLAADDREAEVNRLVGMGAKRVADHEVPGIQWTVMNDPHGNEFCVSQGH